MMTANKTWDILSYPSVQSCQNCKHFEVTASGVCKHEFLKDMNKYGPKFNDVDIWSCRGHWEYLWEVEDKKDNQRTKPHKRTTNYWEYDGHSK